MRCSPVTAALVASVTCARPSDSVHATHVSTVPKQRSRPRPRSSSWSSSHCTFVADWFGRDADAVGRAARGTRRSCAGPASRCPGPTGSPVARSHTIVEPRWLEMPTASTGPGGVERGARELEARRRASDGRVELDEAVGGRVGEQLAFVTRARTCRRRRTTAARTLLVPTSTTSTRPSSRRSRPGEVRRTGWARPSLPGLRMPFGSSASFTDCSTPKPAPSASAHEAGAVEADAVVVAERAAGREHRALPGVPRGAVVRLALVGGRPAREREVEARAVGVRVALVRRRDQRVLDAADRGGRALVDRRAARATSAEISIVSTTKPR